MNTPPRTALAIACLIVLLLSQSAPALRISNHYSPRNKDRPFRRRTDFIVLHTTEGPGKGSLAKVHRYGETHYFVDEQGHVYRIVHRRRVAMHAGRSMWDGKTDLDSRSVAIEVVGYHNRDMTAAQYPALKELVSSLQRIYRMRDENVLTHSMVAYGAPNRWHGRPHRGRKRCGMLFATMGVRRRLGLDDEPSHDPDVRAGRLVVGDPYLARVLYGTTGQQIRAVARFRTPDSNLIAAGRSAWDIARDRYRSSSTVYVFPDGRRLTGNRIGDRQDIPAGTRVVLSPDQRDNAAESVKSVGADGPSARQLAGDEYNKESTIYFLPDGRVRQGHELGDAELSAMPKDTRVLVGYVYGGYITSKRSAYDVCGVRWRSASTYYRMPDGSFTTGSRVNETIIPKGTLIFFQN